MEVHFIHYDSEEEAYEKWKQRAARINKSRLLVKMSIRDNGNVENKVKRFLQLPFENKICFTPVNMNLIQTEKSLVYVPELCDINNMNKDETPAISRYVSVPSIINQMKTTKSGHFSEASHKYPE